ncbi:MAG: hypothetical protein ACRCV9_19100 [Burkholderiaceae bacterium]
MTDFLPALPYLLVMLLAVPAFALMVTFSPRKAWRYSKLWLLNIGGLLVLGGILIVALHIIEAAFA